MDWKRQAVKNKEKQSKDMEKRRAFLVENEGKELEDYRDRYNLKMSALRLRNFEEDPEAEIRKTVTCQCKNCAYMGHAVAGHAMTPFACQECKKTMMHHNTNVPMLCKACGLSFGVCVDCGNPLVV